jgi:hypothetical protein
MIPGLRGRHKRFKGRYIEHVGVKLPIIYENKGSDMEIYSHNGPLL